LRDPHRLKWGKLILNSGEENRENFCKGLDGKPLFSTPYGKYTVTLNELKAILKVSAQAGISGAVNKTSVESTAQDDDFQEVKRRKRHIYNDTSQTVKKSTKPVLTYVPIKQLHVSARNVPGLGAIFAEGTQEVNTPSTYPTATSAGEHKRIKRLPGTL
jgi:hypothetical protein